MRVSSFCLACFPCVRACLSLSVEILNRPWRKALELWGAACVISGRHGAVDREFNRDIYIYVFFLDPGTYSIASETIFYRISC